MSTLRNYQKPEWPELVRKPLGKRVVVLAPHMDDEVIGCAGSLLKHFADGDHITVVYMTDSSKGLPGKPLNKEMRMIRTEESEQSGEILGVNNRVYLEIEDGSTQPWDVYTDRLRAVIKETKPDLLYLPWHLDLHPDHKKTNALFKKAVCDQFNFNICAYEVWSPLPPTIIVNISKQMAGKLAAIEKYRSQTALFPYRRLILSLNAYRACFIPIPGIRFAEAFYQTDCRQYLELISNRCEV